VITATESELDDKAVARHGELLVACDEVIRWCEGKLAARGSANRLGAGQRARLERKLAAALMLNDLLHTVTSSALETIVRK
jgi:hypothetical protein